jgi:arylsulfatase A-like enzyme
MVLSFAGNTRAEEVVAMKNAVSRKCAMLLGAVLLAVGMPVGGAVDRPNVVVIFCDDLGYGDIGPFGARGWKTPHLDRMAAEGRKFTRFYVSSAVCSASRAALLTGASHSRLGIHGAFGPESREGLHPDETTLAELLRGAGYATGIFGKWHLGRPGPLLPRAQGFDEYFGIPYSGDMWPRHPENPRGYPPLPLLEGDEVVAELDDQSDLTKQITGRAVKFVEAHRDKPFFLYVPHPQPHVPLHCSAEFRGRSGAGLYGDVMEELDWSVGEILASVRRCGLERRTLVVFASDNGPWLSYGEHAGSAGPLREGKGTSWEGGIRVPCLMWWPGVIPAGSDWAGPVATIDLLPTVAGFTGVALPGRVLDGRDLKGAVTGQGAVPERELLVRYGGNELQAVISGRWKLILPHAYRTMAGQPRAVGGIPGKYRMARVERAELYDLEADPGERRDVAAEHADVVARLQTAAEQSRDDLGDGLLRRKGRGNRLPGRVP